MSGSQRNSSNLYSLARGQLVDQLAVTVPLDPYLPLRALSGYCGLSVRTLRDLLTHPTRPLPCYRVGGKILVRRSEFDLWMQAHRSRGRVDVDRIAEEMLRELR